MAVSSFHCIVLFVGLSLLQTSDIAGAFSLLPKPHQLSSTKGGLSELPGVPLSVSGPLVSHTPPPSLIRTKRRKSLNEMSFEQFGLKENKKVLVPELPPYWPDPSLDPKPEHLDQATLMALMGADFNRNFMSIEQPAESIAYPKGILEYKFRKNQTPEGQEIPAEIKALEGDEIKLAEDGLALKLKFSRRTRQKLQKFLWTYSYCPVRYRWKKLNQRYWPRWVKHGECDNSRSCSIPAGMTCQPSNTVTVHVLRFICRFERDKRKCKWMRLALPILSECSCSCNS